MNAILESLKNPNATRYLLAVGLSREDYDATRQLALEDKTIIVRNILEHAEDDDVLKIIEKLAKLEFTVQPQDPFRTGNRLAAQLILGYIRKKEESSLQRSYSEGFPVEAYEFSPHIIKMWKLIKSAAESNLTPTRYSDFLTQGFKSLPFFYYQQLLLMPSSAELDPMSVVQRQRTLEASRLPFTERFLAKVSEPLPLASTFEDVSYFDLRTKLAEIKEHILAKDWHVGGFLFFRGGVTYENKRLPHRVNDILQIINRFDRRELEPQAAYRQIIICAKDALDHPRRGRDASTAQFYNDIVTHRTLNNDYSLLKLSRDDDTRRHLV